MKTHSTPSSSPSAAVRSAHASITVRARDTGNDPNEPEFSDEKQTTSVRPNAGRTGHNVSPSSSPSVPSTRGENDGKRFSNTTTSYEDSAISVGKPPGSVGASGSW